MGQGSKNFLFEYSGQSGMQNSSVIVEINLLTITVKGNIHNGNVYSLCSKTCFKHINEAYHVLSVIFVTFLLPSKSTSFLLKISESYKGIKVNF